VGRVGGVFTEVYEKKKHLKVSELDFETWKNVLAFGRLAGARIAKL